MSIATKRPVRPLDLLAPALLLAALMGVVGSQAGLWRQLLPMHPDLAPTVTTVTPHPYTYRAAGDFLRNGVPADGPLVTVTDPTALDIMTFEVTAADYGRCVADGACERAEPRRKGKGDVPMTGVSFNDAMAYAMWLSAATGDTWRLPTIAEWTFAAGSKATDEALNRGTDAGNPAERWLALYEKEAALGAKALASPQPIGSFGSNEFGVFDFAGTVWEWTADCGGRTTLNDAGQVLTHLDSCGVRYVEGRHRAAISGFVRDALSGGCSVGAPPDNLGFRLVRERHWLSFIGDAFDRARRPS